MQDAIVGCLSVALEYDFLKHAVPTLATLFMMFLSERYDAKINEHFNKALLAFRQQLSSPIATTQIDAVLTNSVLLNTIAFFKGHHCSSTSWLYTDTVDLHWLSVHICIRATMSDIRNVLKQSPWAVVYTKEARSFCGKCRAPCEDESFGCEEIPENSRFLSL